MKARSMVLSLGVAAVFLLTAPLLLACIKQRSTTDEAQPNRATTSNTSTPHSIVAMGSASYITARSLADLVAKSAVIVIGQVSGTGEIINMARNPKDSGTTYLLFLIPMDKGFPAGRYWTGPAHPWRFTAPAGGTARPESPWTGASQAFPPRPTASLIGQVEQLVNAQK